MSDPFLNALREHNFYTGDQSIKNQISVTELSLGEILPIYLSRITTEYPPNKLGHHTLGNIFDLGLKQIAIQFRLLPGKRLYKELDNGFVLTGEPDILDTKNNIVYDAKLSKVYAHKMAETNGVSHHYWKQLNYYRILLGGNWRMKIIWGLKDQSAKDDFDEAMVIQNVAHINDGHLIKYAEMMSDRLQILLENGTIPEKCEDTWKDLKCKMYCNYNHVCTYGREVAGLIL